MQGNGVHDYSENIQLEPAVEIGNLPPRPEPVDYSHMIAVISAWASILNARLLAVLSLMGTLGGFAWLMGDPSPMRLYGLATYAILCQAPILLLYLRKG
jgi:hypothetical protein